MADDRPLAEQLADRHAQNESVVEEAQTGTAEDRAAAAARAKARAKAAAAKKKREAEKSGTGRALTSETNAAIFRQIDARIAAATASGNIDMVNDLKAKRKAVAAGG